MGEKATLLEAYNNPSKAHLEDKYNDNIDYFGVIHKDGIPKKLAASYEKIKRADTKKEKKWLQLTPTSDLPSLFRDSPDGKVPEKVVLRIYKGIPHTLRGTIWRLLLGVARVRENHPGVYQDMLVAAHSYSSYIRQIHLDVQRTFRQTDIYYDDYSIRMCSLFNVLVAYSVYNAEIGYTQGMNEVAGFLLMHFPDEEDVFWALSQLICAPKWNMFGVFIPSFPKMFRFFQHLEHIIQRFLPKLHRHFQRCGTRVDVYATKGYLLCFLDRLPQSLVYRLWDLFLLEGEIILHAMFYNILKMHKRRLMRMDDMEVYDWLMTCVEANFGYGDDAAIDSLKSCIEDLRRAHLDRVSPSTAENGELPTKPFGSLVLERRLAEEERKKSYQSQFTISSKRSKKVAKPGQPLPNATATRLVALNESGPVHSQAVRNLAKESSSPATDLILRCFPPSAISGRSSHKVVTNPPVPFVVSKNERVISHSVYSLYRSSSEYEQVAVSKFHQPPTTPAVTNSRREWFVASPKKVTNKEATPPRHTVEGETKL